MPVRGPAVSLEAGDHVVDDLSVKLRIIYNDEVKDETVKVNEPVQSRL